MTLITPEIVLRAYAVGVFPMAENADNLALHWVEPDERGIIPLETFHVSHSLRKVVKRNEFEVRVDTAFPSVIAACAEPTEGRPSTWINGPILTLYNELYEMGHAHSVECWQDSKLVGGLYGLELGAAFFGESMFSRKSNASKVALVHLVARLKHGNFQLLDAQFMNAHLVQFGTVPISRAMYLDKLATTLQQSAQFQAFKEDENGFQVLKTATS